MLKERDPVDWLETISKILFPVVIAVVGSLYSSRQKEADAQRLRLDRDVSYLKLLASTNQEEQNLGLTVIKERKDRKDLSDDLVVILKSLEKGSPDRFTTQAAQLLLHDGDPGKQTNADRNAGHAETSRIPVYIQYAKSEQAADAEKLKQQLISASFDVKQVQPATGSQSTFNTYIRYFEGPRAADAVTVDNLMHKLGYKSNVQDFSEFTDKPLPFLQIWIGKNQDSLATTTIPPDQRNKR